MKADVEKAGEKRLLSVQALRTVAATMVVLLHAEELIRIYGAEHGNSLATLKRFPLGTGVDLFFVISGFVIVYASKSLYATAGARLEFLRRRLIRIVPLYWTALTIRLFALAVGASLGTKFFPDTAAILTSYLFIPYDSLGLGNERPFPIIDLGWSLNYEVFFYVIFACFISLKRDYAVLATAACLTTAILLATLFPPENVALLFWSHPIALEFAFGMLIALSLFHGLTLPNWTRIAMIVIALCLWMIPLSWLSNEAPGLYSWPRMAIWGGGAIMIVAAAVLGPTSFKSRWSQVIANLGDSSYALYLMHPFAFSLVKAALSIVVVPPILYWPLVIATVVFSIACAALFHYLAEVPIVNFLRKQTSRRPVFAPVGKVG